MRLATVVTIHFGAAQSDRHVHDARFVKPIGGTGKDAPEFDLILRSREMNNIVAKQSLHINFVGTAVIEGTTPETLAVYSTRCF